jgi:hypothetical protein
MAQTDEAATAAVARKRTRSPAYPFINLETALTRAKQFYDREQRNPTNINVAATHWGYTEGSSYGIQTVASLIYFGLMQDEGTGEKRSVRLTQAALRILLDARPNSAERAELIKQAALAPKIHQQLWKKWGADYPSDASLRHTLLFDWETPFNENAVDAFIAEYKSTIAFAQLVDSGKASQLEAEGEEREKRGRYIAKVEDYVQWEHNGVLGLPEPLRVREVSPDGNYAYLEGQNGAVPITELVFEVPPPRREVHNVVEVTPLAPTIRATIQEPVAKPFVQEFIVPLADGRKAVFQWPSVLSQDDVDDLLDSLKILERKISRSTTAPKE